MRLRQVALVARQLEPVRSQLFSLLGIEEDFADPGVGEFGLHNSVMALGDTFLEVVAPVGANTTAERLLDRRDGDGGYMVLLQVDSIGPVKARVDDMNVRRIWNIDREDVKAFHVHPKDIGAAIVSFDEMIPAPSWVWAGPDWHSRKATLCGDIRSVTVQALDPEAIAAKWAKICACDYQLINAQYVIQLSDNSQIRFVEATDHRGDGVSGFGVAVPDVQKTLDRAAALGLTIATDQSVHLGGVTIGFES